MKLAIKTVLAICGLAIAWAVFALNEREPDRLGISMGAEFVLGAHPTELEAENDNGNGRVEALSEAPPELSSPDPVGANSSDLVLARVVNEAGAPVKDAWLRLRQDPDHTERGDAEGRLALSVRPGELARMAGLNPNRRVEVEVGAKGYRVGNMGPSVGENSEVLQLGEVTLSPGGELYGTVVDETGLGIEGALVAFGLPTTAEPGDMETARRGPRDLHVNPWDGHDPAIVGLSGPGGAFHLEGLPAGYGTAWARTQTSRWAYSEPVGVRVGEQVFGIELVVLEAPNEVITGTLVDPDGLPLRGLELTFTRSHESQGWRTHHTDSRGGFYFTPTDGAAQDIRARSPSWEWEDRNVLAVEAGTHDLVIAFERSSWLLITAQDASGKVVPNGRVVGLPGSGPTDRSLPRCESPLDEEGHARLRRPADPLRVRVEAPGYRDQIAGPFNPAQFPDPLLVTLESIPALIGQVLLPDGSPAAGARVSLHRGAGESTQTERYHLTHQGWSGDRDAFVYALMVEPTAQVTADDEGHFRLPLPGADHNAEGEVEPDNDDSPAARVARFRTSRQRAESAQPNVPWFVHAAVEGNSTITSGPHVFQPTDDVPIELRLPRGGSIAGHLVLDDGATPIGWTAQASDGLAQVAASPVDVDGSFHFENLHEGGWQVRVFEPGRPYHASGGKLRTDRVPTPDVEVTAGQTVAYEHQARKRVSALLRGRLWVDGAPPGPWRVNVRTMTPQASIISYEMTLDPDGRFKTLLEPDLKTFIDVFRIADGVQLAVHTQVTIVPGDNDWSFEFETAELQVEVDLERMARDAFGSGPTYESEQAGVTIRVSAKADENGRVGPILVPSGPGILLGPREDFRTPAPVWAEIDLAAGEKRSINLR